MSITAEEIITNLDLQPHPEGGWYRETFNNRADGEIRGTMTAIYFLLKKGKHHIGIGCWMRTKYGHG